MIKHIVLLIFGLVKLSLKFFTESTHDLLSRFVFLGVLYSVTYSSLCFVSSCGQISNSATHIVTATLSLSNSVFVFTRESSYCFQRVLAIAILSVCLSARLSHRWISQKTVVARITKFLPSAAWKTLVSGTIKLFHKLKGVDLEQDAK